MSIEAFQADGGPELQFGPFRLFPQQRLLLRTDSPLRLGSRAREILLLLVERAGEVVMKSELIARVWSNTVVEEGTLRVHINWLRKALSDGKSGIQYIESVTGIGYRFIAPVIRREQAHTPERRISVPPTRMIGRDAILSTLTSRLTQMCSTRARLLTIVGSGGSGKSTVAVELANRLHTSYPDGVRFIDLAAASDLSPPAAVAATLGSGSGAHDLLTPLGDVLRSKRMLLVLDNCEHVASSTAVLVEELLGCAPGLHILATSREPLRTRSEWLLHLPALNLPAAGSPVSAKQALDFPAVQLFVERATASRDTFELTDANAPVVVDICRKLDGLPLAIELAAARVDCFGVHEVRARINDPLGFLTRGSRTAPVRHQTLRATLDWSYATLSAIERIAFHRLSIFERSFDLNAAVMEVSDATIEPADVPDIIATLAAKSLLVREEVGGRVLYKFLTTARAYAIENEHPGLSWSAQSVQVEVSDLRAEAAGMAIPCRIADLQPAPGAVHAGTLHDTAQFAREPMSHYRRHRRGKPPCTGGGL